MLHFTEADVKRVLSMPQAIACMRAVFHAYGRGEAINQPRRRLYVPTGAVLHQMAGSYGRYFGTKVYSTHARHGAWFTFLLYDAETAKPLAQFEANHLGQIRTGATTGYAVDLLARPEVKRVAIIGSGFQAETQLDAIRAVRSPAQVTVWSRSESKRKEFADKNGAQACQSVEEALDGADVVVTSTSSKEPVFPSTAITGTPLICAIGSNYPDRREVPAEIVERARIVVDDVEQCRIEAGDLLLARTDWNTVEPLASLAVNGKAGHQDRLTLFKSVGLGIEDVAAAAYILEHT
jgi:alanine dehydrogenase